MLLNDTRTQYILETERTWLHLTVANSNEGTFADMHNNLSQVPFPMTSPSARRSYDPQCSSDFNKCIEGF